MYTTPLATLKTAATKTTTRNAQTDRALEAAMEYARKHLDRVTLDDQRTGADFFETSVWSIRAIVKNAFEAGFNAAANR